MREGLQHGKPVTELSWIAAFGMLAAISLIPEAHAVPKAASDPTSTPCASVISQGGRLQVLDQTRTQLLEVTPGKPVPCGSWVSTEKGWMVLRHKDGHQIHVGSGTFVHFPARGEMDEQLVLYKGQLYLHPEYGSGQLQILTANARARTSRGRAIVVFSSQDETTQLIGLEEGTSLENRFEESRKMTLKPGEATSLNMTALRVVPETPQAVSLTELKLKLDDLQVSTESQRVAILNAKQRQERRFAASFDAVEGPDGKVRDRNYHRLPKRGLASQHDEKPAKKKSSRGPYARHPIPEAEKRKLTEQWVSRLVGGAKGAEELLVPGNEERVGRKPASRGRVVVEELGGYKSPHRQKEEDAEKKRLIEELSRIRLH